MKEELIAQLDVTPATFFIVKNYYLEIAVLSSAIFFLILLCYYYFYKNRYFFKLLNILKKIENNSSDPKLVNELIAALKLWLYKIDESFLFFTERELANFFIKRNLLALSSLLNILKNFRYQINTDIPKDIRTVALRVKKEIKRINVKQLQI